MKIKFWVAIGKERQLNFEGQMTEHEVPVGNQHIVHNEVLMCRQSRAALKGSNKQSTRMLRFSNAPLCEECEKAYKSHPDSEWARWNKMVLEAV